MADAGKIKRTEIVDERTMYTRKHNKQVSKSSARSGDERDDRGMTKMKADQMVARLQALAEYFAKDVERRSTAELKRILKDGGWTIGKFTMTLAMRRAVFWFTILHRSLRLHQWAKNGLIFVPLVLGGKGGQSAAWLNALIGFLALGFAASSTYIINDLRDLPNDRKHRSKRNRPLASGDLSIRFGIFLAIASLAIGFALAAYASLGAVAMLALYVALSLSYSFYWKRVPILDAFVLAILFTSRLGMGVALTDVRPSVWLFVFSMFIFTSLSMAKRNTEVLASTGNISITIPGRGYVSNDAPLILALGIGTAISAVLVMILYLIEDAYPRQFYANPAFLWALPAILFLFLGRVWLVSERRQMHDDPVAFALKDRISLLLGLLMSLALAASFIRFGPI